MYSKILAFIIVVISVVNATDLITKIDNAENALDTLKQASGLLDVFIAQRSRYTPDKAKDLREQIMNHIDGNYKIFLSVADKIQMLPAVYHPTVNGFIFAFQSIVRDLKKHGYSNNKRLKMDITDCADALIQILKKWKEIQLKKSQENAKQFMKYGKQDAANRWKHQSEGFSKIAGAYNNQQKFTQQRNRLERLNNVPK